MAKTRKDMEGWDIVLEGKTGMRHARRTKASGIKLCRKSDNLTIVEGDCISFILDSESNYKVNGIGFIKDINFGIDRFLAVNILWMVKYTSNLDSILPLLPNNEKYTNGDVFLSPFLDPIKLSQIIRKVQVVSIHTFHKLQGTSEEPETDVFTCRRFTDETSTYFTDVVDWDTMMDSFKENKDEFYDSVKMLTMKSKSPVKKTMTTRRVSSPSTPTKGKAIKKKKHISDSSDNSDLEIKEIKAVKVDTKYDDVDVDVDDDDILYSINADQNGHMPTSEDEIEDVIEDFKPVKRKRGRPRLSPIKSAKLTHPELPIVEPETADFLDGEYSTTQMLVKAKKILGTGTKLKFLPCREREFEQIYRGLKSSILSQKGCCIYVSGTPGVGKTATIREVIKQLSAKMAIESNGHKMFNFLEINGLKLIKPQQAYDHLWTKLSGMKTSTNNSLNFLQRHFEADSEDEEVLKGSSKLPLVVLLDELDQIVTKNQAVMYNFFNWPTYPNSKLIVVAVANTMDLPERLLTNKISSRLGLSRIQFTSYSYNQLSEIIKHRLEQLSKDNENLIIAKDAIEFASRKVASVSGDARRSLMICIRAVEIAQNEYMNKSKCERENLDGKYTVTIMHIMKAVNETSSSPVVGYLNSLPFLSKLVLLCIMLRKKRLGIAEIRLGEIYDELSNQAQVLLFSELKKSLKGEDLGLLDIFFGSGKNRMMGSVINASLFILKDLEENGILIMQSLRIERDRLVRLNISDDEILSILKRDPMIQEIITFI